VLVYWLLRSSSPELGWNHHGNVQTNHLNHWDLLGVMIIFLFYGLNLLTPFTSSAAEPKAELTASAAWSSSVLQLLVVIIPIALIGRNSHLPEVLGLKPRNIAFVILLAIAGWFLAAFINAGLMALGLESFIERVFGSAERQEVVDTMAKAKDPALLIALFVAAVIVAPIVEEIFFRGYLYTVAKRFSDRFFAAIISSLIFALMHGNMIALLPLFFLALILAGLFELTGSLWAPIALHMLFNGISTAVLIFGELPEEMTPEAGCIGGAWIIQLLLGG